MPFHGTNDSYDRLRCIQWLLSVTVAAWMRRRRPRDAADVPVTSHVRKFLGISIILFVQNAKKYRTNVPFTPWLCPIWGPPLINAKHNNTLVTSLLITCQALPGSPEGREAIFCIPSGKGYVNPNVMASLFDVELPKDIFFMVQ